MGGNEGPRGDWKWRLVREGEVSPYKILVSLFIRENYLGECRKNLPLDERLVSTEALLLIYKLIKDEDMTYSELKAVLVQPKYKVRPEVLRRFHRILNSLEPSNSYFLYEFVYSIISIESSQTIVLKKKVGKNSPLGKYQRNVYMNIRRMSYPQVHYLFTQFCQFLGKRIPEHYNPPKTPGSKNAAGSTSNAASPAPACGRHPFKGLQNFQRLSAKLGGRIDIFAQYLAVCESRKNSTTPTTSSSSICEKSGGTPTVLKQPRKPVQANPTLRNLWNPETNLETGTFIQVKLEDVESLKGSNKRRWSARRTAHPPTPRLRSPRKAKASLGSSTLLCFPEQRQFRLLEEGEEGYFPTGGGVGVTDSGRRKAINNSPQLSQSQEFKEEPDLDLVNPATGQLLPSKRWEEVKWWSRKQIEKTLRVLSDSLFKTDCPSVSPRIVSEFVEAVSRNPSAQVLFPQLQFLEYLSGVRVKDVTRCAEALRTSFDIRIKPNTSELSKGTPYAAYNFALFFNLLGYKDDAKRSLEEAFRAGHAAGDATCLHHCHNLWSIFNNKPYTDAIVTVTKEVDNNMAYLHSVNVIANAFDYHYQGLSTDEVLYSLWHYNSECDLEEMEALLLTSLTSFFTVFGWHEMTAFPSQMILQTKWKWPAKAYCFALCSLSQSLLFHGDIETPQHLMEYGHSLFSIDSSPAGQLFTVQYATFQAVKAYLAYMPLEPEVICTIVAFDPVEASYWEAYNKMMKCDWRDAGNILGGLWKTLNSREQCYENNDLKIRCLLMQAELECLCRAPAKAMSYLSEALEMAYLICSDLYVTLVLSHIASIQCEMALFTTGSRTMHKDLRAAIRCSSPWLKARLNVVNVKLSMKLQKLISLKALPPLMDKLNWAEELYKRWQNNYRLKEILHLKIELLDRSEDLAENGNSLRKRFNSMKTCLPWSSSTSLM